MKQREKVITGLVHALKLSLRYLEHPDVRAIPFCCHADVAAERAKEEIAKAELLESDFLIDEIAGFLNGLSIGNGEVAKNAKTLHEKLLATA